MKACWSSYLCFWQVELPCQLRALAAHHVLATLELQLQPVQLLSREGGPGSFGPVQVQTFGQDDLPDCSFGVCANGGKHKECMYFVNRLLKTSCYIITDNEKNWFIIFRETHMPVRLLWLRPIWFRTDVIFMNTHIKAYGFRVQKSMNE